MFTVCVRGSYIALTLLVAIEHRSLAWGYRPFVSTDAAVVDSQEIEIELGYFNLERADQENTFITPKVVVNYGLFRNWEAVGEFEVEKPPDESAQLVEPGLFLKAVLKEGVLQNKDGVGFAIEAGPLLPSTIAGERKFGFEGIGILSGKLFPFMYHVNFGGGVDRTKTNPFTIWGVIVELPVLQNFRLVGEVSGENIKKKFPDESVLFGFIWELPSAPILVDGGIRKSLSRGAPDWQFITGLTWSFSFPSFTSTLTSGGTP
ncbi:MAG TPA: hypothetical protein VGX03_30660 [Candidatus Binatia bacterium]|jgi:hypothetical protein|nr:hypothetical protein [Candidatus Binatia bacterium]